MINRLASRFMIEGRLGFGTPAAIGGTHSCWFGFPIIPVAHFCFGDEFRFPCLCGGGTRYLVWFGQACLLSDVQFIEISQLTALPEQYVAA